MMPSDKKLFLHDFAFFARFFSMALTTCPGLQCIWQVCEAGALAAFVAAVGHCGLRRSLCLDCRYGYS